MHREAYAFVKRAVGNLDSGRKIVVDLGSYDVNSTEQGLAIKPLFKGSTYIGVDVREGPNVDVVAKAERYTPDKPADVVLSTEMLEHHPKPEAVIQQAFKILKPGGVLILTAAAPERRPHGNDGGPVGKEHYANISPEQLQTWLEGWADVRIEHNPTKGDVYVTATKPGEPAPEESDADRTSDKA